MVASNQVRFHLTVHDSIGFLPIPPDANHKELWGKKQAKIQPVVLSVTTEGKAGLHNYLL